jgi:alpha-aminoadipate carrier protein LysW
MILEAAPWKCWWRLEMSVLCPECESPVEIDVDEVEEGERIPCEECGAELEVVSVEPLKVALVDDSGYDDPDEPLFVAGEEDEE